MKTEQFLVFIMVLLVSTTLFSQSKTSQYLPYNFDKNRLEYLIDIDKDSVAQKVAPNGERYLLIDFSFVGCGGCMKELPKLHEYGKELKEILDIVVVWERADHAFWKSYFVDNYSKTSFLNLCDTKCVLTGALKLNIAPAYMLFDKNACLLKQWKGRLPKSFKKLLK